jgi:hypothetical protein
MKDFVAVPDSLLEKTEELKKYLNMSFAYVKTLKPKATKKAAPKKASSQKAKQKNKP